VLGRKIDCKEYVIAIGSKKEMIRIDSIAKNFDLEPKNYCKGTQNILS
jgi:hypothetical protein